MPSTISIKDDMQQLFLHRQIICDIVKASPFFGSDYTDKYFWNKKDHPYKNLCNCILWCEYWYEKIKVSNKQEKILPKYRSVEILATNQEMQQHLDNIHALANSIRDKILNDNVDISDFGPNLTQYNLEQKLFAEITPNLDFLRPKLETMYAVLQEMPPILEKNKAITHDFKDCFIKANLSIKQLEINLHKLVDKYGIDELNNYAKSAWYFYEKFDISEILAQTAREIALRISIEQKLGYVPEISKLPIETAKWDSSGFLDWVNEHFFTEIDTCFKLYDEARQTLESLLSQQVTNWDIKLFELIEQLYIFKCLRSRVGKMYLDWGSRGERGYWIPFKENSTNEEEARTHNGNGDIFWRVATRGYLFSNSYLKLIELSQENRWQLFNYQLIYMLKKVSLDLINEIDSESKKNTFIKKILNNYINHSDLSSLYKLVLLFIDLSKYDTIGNIKPLIALIEIAKYFVFTPLDNQQIEFIDNKTFKF